MKKLYAILVITALFALVPSTALAQYYSQSPRYETRYNNGQAAYYLLPSGFSAGYSSSYQGNSPASALSVSCTATPITARAGEEILWYSSVTGGAGNYTYSWSGADGLFGTQSTVRKAYATAGEKYATVTVISGGQSAIAGCSQIVQIMPSASIAAGTTGGTAGTRRLGASCFAVTERVTTGESATWFAIVSGASPSTTTAYQWDGTDGLTGNGPAVFKTYGKNGLKHALLTVTSGGERIMSVCTNAIAVGPTTVTLAQAPTTKPITTVTKTAATQISTTAMPSASEQIASGGTGTGTTEQIAQNKDNTENAAQPQKEKRNLAAALISGFGNPITLILLALLAVLVGIFLATRRNRNENNPAN